MHDGSEQVIGVVFPSVDIPAGVTIAAASVIFDVDEVRPGQSDAVTTATIYGELNANPAAPSNTAFDLSNRVPTAASVTWQPEPSVAVHDELITPDIANIVQEIIGVPGWAAGNPMSILFSHVSGSGTRWVEAFSTNNGIDTPALQYTYISGAGGPMSPPVTETYSVAGRPDGAEEDVTTGAMYLTSSDYEIMHDGSGDANEQVVGVIFPSVGVPSGAFITEARVIFDVDEVRPGQSDKSVTVNIYGEANTNPAAPSNTASDLSNRVPTAAAVTWVPETSVGVHDDLITPDIRTIVQEIVDLPGWTPGNPMGILFGHVTGTGSRWVEAFSTNNGIDTPALTVTYSASDMRTNAVDELYSTTGRPDSAEESVPSGQMYLTSSDLEMVHDGTGEQVVSVVFPAVNVPPGATVTAANVIFDVDEVRPGQSDADVTISIYGQVGPAAAVTETRWDVTARPATASSVIWQPEPSVGEHDDLLTPDISAVVNEIVNHCSWTAGSGMGIMFGHMTGSGSRWVEAFRNNNGIDTPALSVSYLAPTSTPTVCDAPPLAPPAPPPPPPPPPGVAGDTVMALINGRADGGEENVGNGNMYLTSSDYE